MRAAAGTAARVTLMDTAPAFTVEPHGKRWAIKSDGEVLLIAARKADAQKLAKAAAASLTTVHRPPERRTFSAG